MTEDLDKLEAEVEAMLASLASKLSVRPRPAAVERTKAAVRHQLNESWLADQATPAPSPFALQRVRSAIDDELKRPMYSFARTMTWASLAAAAMIAICVGVLHYGQTVKPSPLDLDLFVQAAEETLMENPFTTAITLDLDVIEDSINNLATTTNYDTEILYDIGNQIDELFIEPEWLEDTSTGAIG
ncbi:MAG: hypothetical protein JSV03_13705 [Planctomycetota bacterium]|nr:MAG: hypothetical protein JSV03_13705 [Planctomycetota bacterium]